MPARILSIANWLKGNIIISDISDDKYIEQALLILSLDIYRPLINKLIERADLGFVTIIDKIDSLSNRKTALNEDLLKSWFKNELKDFSLYATHKVYDKSYRLVDTVQFEVLKMNQQEQLNF